LRIQALTVNAHLDYSLEIAGLGEAILMEPRARVIYDKSRLPSLTGADREFLLYRWNLYEAAASN
jgi:hypothetical protein